SSSSSGRFRRPCPDNSCACDECCEACQYTKSPHGVRYFNGEFQHPTTAFSFGGFGQAWGHSRYYSNQRFRNSGLVKEDYGHGTNWFANEWPYITNYNEDGSIVAVSLGQSKTLFFQWSGTAYAPLHGAQDRYALTTSSGSFKLTEPSGAIWEFQDFSSH